VRFDDPVVHPSADVAIDLVQQGAEADVIVLRARRVLARRDAAEEREARSLVAAERADERRAHADRLLYRA
jgi:hypothetical protein